jgi:hypothetical protein
MGIWYEGTLSYYNAEEKAGLMVGDAFIQSFSVDGGASRTINLKSPTDMSISSELEQARQFKNLTLFMPPTKNHRDMETALQLSQAAVKKNLIAINFSIQKIIGQTLLEMISLIDLGATVKMPPTIVGNHMLKIDLALSKTRIAYDRPVKKGGDMVREEM